MKLEFLCFCTLGLLSPVALSAQEQALVEELAPVLAAEDAREWRQDLFQRSLLAADSVVQRVAAMAAGRIGDLRATPLLIRTLDQPDSTVRVAAAFALGLLRDSAAVEPMIQRLTGLQPLDAPSAVEAVTALAKIGGRRVADFFTSVLQGKVMLSQPDVAPATTQILLEAWRLGTDAPADALLPFTRDTLQTVRWSAVYSLARLRAPGAAAQLLESLRDPDAATRALAARALSREYAETARLAPATVAAVLTRAVEDKDPGVRINALRSLGTYRDSSLAPAVAWRVEDPVASVRVQAAITLGELGGAAARTALLRVLNGKGGFAVRREALLGLAAVDGAEFSRAAASWRASGDWRERSVAAEGSARAGAGGAQWFL
ncbi:MAG: peptidyl-prolyl cis-trans isomerase cyclophilin type, partial [Geminicoccaceae bacterium]|nr:peptidyl-prolyl cis-trans isomerase cyclophilin type [Geminicoccaceae bacterium]